MREAISNLIDNAIKFTPVGGVVRIEARMAEGRPFALVSDTGVGVPSQERAKIFDRFYRGERSSQTPGHGLGLSIAETIAKLHGFKLTIEDNKPRLPLRISPHCNGGADAGERRDGVQRSRLLHTCRNYILM